MVNFNDHIIVEIIDHKKVQDLEKHNAILLERVKTLEDQLLSLEYKLAGISSLNHEMIDVLRTLGYKDLKFLGHVEAASDDVLKSLCELLYIPEL